MENIMARSPCVRSGQDCKDKVIKVIILETVDFHLSHVGREVRQEVAKCPMIAADAKLYQEGSKHREKASPRPPHCWSVECDWSGGGGSQSGFFRAGKEMPSVVRVVIIIVIPLCCRVAAQPRLCNV